MATVPSTGGETSSQPGSIKIDAMTLSSGSRSPVNIANLIKEFNIYESISQEFMSINMIIHDASSLFTLFPLTGDETLQVQFSTPDPAFQTPFKYTFRIVSITDLAQAEEVRTVQYRLRGVAQEAFKDWTTRIRKSYPGGNSNGGPISDMISKIYNESLKTGSLPLKTSTTDGNHTYVIPNMRPSEAIKFLCREAKSSQYPASNFIFYGTADGYFFKTFDEIMSEQKTGAMDRYIMTSKQYDQLNQATQCAVGPNGLPDLTIAGIQAAVYGEKPSEFRKVIQYKFNRVFDIEHKIQNGGFDNTVFYLDINKSTYEVQKYNYKTDYDKLKWVDKGKVVNSTTSPLLNLKGDSHHRFIHVAKDNDNVNIDQKQEFLHLQTASVAMMDYVQVDLVIPGDATRRVGDRIEIVIPEYSRFEETIGLDSITISGVYTVTALRHTYNVGASGYTTQMQCLKNSYKNNPEKGLTIQGGSNASSSTPNSSNVTNNPTTPTS